MIQILQTRNLLGSLSSEIVKAKSQVSSLWKILDSQLEIKWRREGEEICITVKWCSYISGSARIHTCNIQHCPEVGLFRNNPLITVLSSVLMLCLPFSNLNWMPLIKSVFSGAHTCTQSSNLKEKIWLFIFVFRFPASWHSRQRPAFEWGFWGNHQSLFSVQQSVYSPPESVVFLWWLLWWQKEGGRERMSGVRSVF